MIKLITLRMCVMLTLCVVLLSSCKKDSETGSYIKFKMDGNWVTWKDVLGEIVPEPGGTQSGFDFSAHSVGVTEAFALGIQVNGNFSTGTYTPDNSFMSLDYTKKANTPNFTSYTGGGIMGGSDTRYEITITSITDKTVKGHFTGSYLRNISDDNDLLKITEGEFVVPRVR